MMGRLKSDQGQLFYEFRLGDAGVATSTAAAAVNASTLANAVVTSVLPADSNASRPVG